MSEENESAKGSQQEEEENPEPPLMVQKEQLTKGLSRIQRTHDGSSYAFAALTMEETDPPVEDLGNELQQYEHLQHLYLKQNGLRDIASIAHLHHLLTVNASQNAVASIKFLEELGGSDRLQFLQRLDLSGNKLKELSPLPQPRLSWVNLSQNGIKSCADFTGHNCLATLLLSENKLSNCAGISAMPKLLELNLSGNALTSLKDLLGLGALKKLDASKNKLETLADFPILPELEFFDAGENLIEKDGEKELENLKECSALKQLNMAGNPWVDEKGDDFKKEVLIALDNLKIKQVNDMDEVTEEEVAEAKTEKQEREKARLEAEEEARRAAEEAANQPKEGEEANEE